jgi:proline dehydrogenase
MESSAAGWRLAKRFVAGTTLPEVVAAVRAANAAGLAATIDQLGENVVSAELARATAQSYHAVLDAIQANRLDANVSIKLTHLGLDLPPQRAKTGRVGDPIDGSLCGQLTGSLVEHATRNGSFIRVDMEGSAYTQRTLDLVRALHRSGAPTPASRDQACWESHGKGAVGTVIQSCLRRSRADAALLCSEGIRIRLVKGAYREPREIAFPRKAEVDDNFLELARKLLSSGLYHAIATHDERLIAEIIAFARQENMAREAFEFQMLYGVRRELQQRLAAQGWRVRIYIPFGTEWYPYFMRRLAERPANVWFLLKNLVRE